MLKMTMTAIGWSFVQATPVVCRTVFRIPSRRSSRACHRKATTEPGRIQASSTSTFSVVRTARGAVRKYHASRKPRMFCPITAENPT